MTEKKKVVVAMSGGVDSTLTARLLQEAGYDVYGATMNQFDGQDLTEAQEMADFLGIPHKVIDVRKMYQDVVLSYFVDSYKNGITPNPCMMCDFKIKFGFFYDTVRAYFDCPYFATGHYARITYDGTRGKYQVEKAADTAKDQSYMMYHLTQDQLAHILFPLGRMYKKDTRRISEEKGLPTYNKAESQDICFLTSEKSYAEFLQNHAPEAFRPGNIIDTKGRILGRHKGLPFYTIGQRKGLGIPSNRPLYVKAIDPKSNQVVLSENDALFSQQLTGENFNWIAWEAPPRQFRCSAKIRYRQTEQPCEVTVEEDGSVQVLFDRPQRAITPGQAVVLYDGDTVLGGGTIL